jgi:hypothetical protein
LIISATATKRRSSLTFWYSLVELLDNLRRLFLPFIVGHADANRILGEIPSQGGPLAQGQQNRRECVRPYSGEANWSKRAS